MISQRLKLPLGLCPFPGSNQDSSHVVRLSGLEICQAITDKSLTRQTHAQLLLDSRQQSGARLAAQTGFIGPMWAEENTFNKTAFILNRGAQLLMDFCKSILIKKTASET